MAAHGAQKVLGWFDGPGLAGFAARLEQTGVRPGRTWAIVSGAVELGGGLLVAAGLITPVAALFLAGNLLVAILTMHLARGFWNRDGGYEFPLALPEPATWLAIVIVVLLGVIAAAASGRLPAPDQSRESAR